MYKRQKLFIIFAYLTLILVVAAFASIVANTFKATYTADGLVDLEASAANASTAIISIMFIVMAILFGFFVYRRNAPLGIATVIGVIGIVVCMVIGLNWHPIYPVSYTHLSLRRAAVKGGIHNELEGYLDDAVRNSGLVRAEHGLKCLCTLCRYTSFLSMQALVRRL